MDIEGRNGASILLEGRLGAGRIPNLPYSYHLAFSQLLRAGRGKPSASEVQGDAGCRSVAGGNPRCGAPTMRRSGKTRAKSLFMWRRNYASLRARTVNFKEALFSSTLPPYVLDAVSANLAILKSPTVLREENGNLWGWEGCFPDNGCCEGSCTHVWNYAQAFPIFILNWSGLCENWNTSVPWMNADM